jgi:hypothetical protein
MPVFADDTPGCSDQVVEALRKVCARCCTTQVHTLRGLCGGISGYGIGTENETCCCVSDRWDGYVGWNGCSDAA